MILRAGVEICPGYRLTQPIGRGGFGEVWEAVAPDGTAIAMKFIDCMSRSDSGVGREVRLLLNLRKVQHPNLIQLRNVLAFSPFVVICMELADGSLHDLHEVTIEDTGKPLAAGYLCQLLTQAAGALDFLATQNLNGAEFLGGGFQHCDIKPRNLLLIGDTLKVADFGLCMPQLRETRRRVPVGTPPYCAPEFREGRVTQRSDQFALAVTYCELRTGRLPFPRGKTERHFASPDLSALSPCELPILARALDRSWLKRWPTCVAFMSALSHAVNQEFSPRTPPPQALIITRK